MDRFSYLSNADVAYLDGLYQQYKQDPASVDVQWARFFEGFDFGQTQYPTKRQNGAASNGQSAATAPAAGTGQVAKEIGVLNLIAAYRVRGHLFANINPILARKQFQPDLNMDQFGLTEADLDTVFQAGNEIGIGAAKLRDIIAHLTQTYVGNIGVEFAYIRNPDMVHWLQERMERDRNTPKFDKDTKKHILRKLGQATSFEGFLHRKFVGQKRFSLEGSESLIPAMDGIIEHGAGIGVKEFVIGMAHRGRLNVLVNIMQKEYDAVFGEFEGKGLSDTTFDGDVKYHMGFSSDPKLRNGSTVHLSLAPNPSHLEAVDPVVVGMCRAKMDNLYEGDHDRICPILIHGDASVAGQGIVYELIQMSRLPAYEVGGAIHIVINNQIGFTTPEEQGRSSTYCTDVAKVTLSPVFHVNGDDPEALTYATRLAIEFRQEFNRDVFIDIIGFRKYGHNEGDEPRFTQPRMYEVIGKHPDTFKIYSQKLIQEGAIAEADVKALEQELGAHLDKELEEARATQAGELDTNLQRVWSGIKFYDDNKYEGSPDSQVAQDVLVRVSKVVSTIPEGFSPHPTIKKLLDQRAGMLAANKVDWGMAEHLAYGSLLVEGRDVRISGQDVERGTFSHRHAVLTDNKSDQKYIPLNNIAKLNGGAEQGRFFIYNSLLSEYAVMGFEYGYASSAPKTLTIWEAQFGDFVNGAQIIIDQFLSASKSKWQRMNGLVLLLPHGYEGQGPEHSSARIERFLTLSAQNNMYVCNITTPANLFHALRRQVLTSYRRPLVVFSPKSLLRHERVVSTVDDFTKGKFQEVIDDAAADPKQVKRVVLTFGKLYYDLLKAREDFDVTDTALVRIEQLYPWPGEQLAAVLKRYSGAKQFVWAQEEPENMGGWSFVLRKLRSMNLDVVARKESASTAPGTMSQHLSQQQYLIKKALNLPPDTDLNKAAIKDAHEKGGEGGESKETATGQQQPTATAENGSAKKKAKA